MATLQLRIVGLRSGDEPRIERALRDLPGVYGVVVSPTEGCAELDIEDDEVSLDRILELLREHGLDGRLSG